MSIKRRLLFLLILILMTISLISYVVSYWAARHEMDELFDAELAHTARLVRSTYGPLIDAGVLHKQTTLSRQNAVNEFKGHEYERKVLFQVLQHGEIVFESMQSQLQLNSIPNQGFSRLTVGGFDWYLYALQEKDLTYIVGERADIRAELARDMLMGYLVPISIGLPMMLLLVFWVVNKGLLPLKQLANQIRHRDVTNLTPILNKDIPGEMQPVVDSLNQLLAALGVSMEMERRFTAMASHEMRTPISALKINLQNVLRTSDPEEKQRYLVALEQGIHRASRLMEQLLTLNKLEETSLQYEMRQIDVLVLLRDEIASLYTIANEKQLVVGLLNERDKCQVETVPQLLGLIVRNLIENGVKHASGQVEVRVTEDVEDRMVRIAIEDDGPGIPEADYELVFKPFVRLPGETAMGSGLGLAIAKRSSDLLNIKLIPSKGTRLGGLKMELILSRGKEKLN